MLKQRSDDVATREVTDEVAAGSRLPSVLAAGFVMVCAVVVAGTGVIATAGGVDQEHFHLPSVMAIRETFPHIDIVNLPTATSPLYHLVVAAISGPLGLSQLGTQIVGALFAAALAALAFLHARSVPGRYLRVLAVCPLLLSPYFWQSALWMLTDDAAILFAMAALILLQRDLTIRRQCMIGLLVAAAVATRQTFVWAMVPAMAACVCSLRGESRRSVAAALTRVSLPGVAVLAVLIVMWGGLTPPAGQVNAATQSWTSISFVFAVATLFAVPIFLATMRFDVLRSHARMATLVGTVAGVPALVFTSAATSGSNSPRRGGIVWSLVDVFPDIAGRSVLLPVLAFIGGFTCTALFYVLNRHTAVVLSTALITLAVAMAPGAQLYQKYAELPIAMLAVLAIVSLSADKQIRRSWPLLSLAVFQAVVTVGIVVVRVIRLMS